MRSRKRAPNANCAFSSSQDIYFWLILFLHIKLIGNVRFCEYCWFSHMRTNFLHFLWKPPNSLLLFKLQIFNLSENQKRRATEETMTEYTCLSHGKVNVRQYHHQQSIWKNANQILNALCAINCIDCGHGTVWLIMRILWKVNVILCACNKSKTFSSVRDR